VDAGLVEHKCCEEVHVSSPGDGCQRGARGGHSSGGGTMLPWHLLYESGFGVGSEDVGLTGF